MPWVGAQVAFSKTVSSSSAGTGFSASMLAGLMVRRFLIRREMVSRSESEDMGGKTTGGVRESGAQGRDRTADRLGVNQLLYR